MADGLLIFVAQVDKAVAKSKSKLDRLVRQSANELIKDAQVPVAKGGRMPVLTGFLRNSLLTDVKGKATSEGEDSYVTALRGVKAGDSIRFTWTALYAMIVEGGYGARPARFFARGAAEKWKGIVERIARKLVRE